jgi:hypothetical protein
MMRSSSIKTIFLGAALAVCLGAASEAQAATNINATSSEHFAWNDVIGWIDLYNTNSIVVSPTGVSGYASSSAGSISLDCSTSPAGNICGTSNYRVTNDGLGNLSGWGWNDSYGWISFDCNNNAGCGTSNYRVLVNPTTGVFTGYAWNDLIGWISFNCSNTSGCGVWGVGGGGGGYATSTNGWLDSSPFDTGVTGGAQLNSVMWRGSLPAGTRVDFQFAVSNSSSGPWTFMGTDGTVNTYFTAAVDTPVSLSPYSLFANKRYFRYRIWMTSNQAQTLFPRVDDVIVNWSP